MWSVKDMFYGGAEPVWITKPEKEDSNKGEIKRDSQASAGANKKHAEKIQGYPAPSTVPYYPYYADPFYYDPNHHYYSPNTPSAQQPKKVDSNKGGAKQQQQQQQHQQHQQQYQQQQQQHQPKKESRLVLKVPICCGECVESIECTLYRMKGVKSVECDTYREKVTVLATTASPADILMGCRRVFKKSRFWTDDD